MTAEHQFSLAGGDLPSGRSPNITVVGTQWGDEGKGKIVDWCAASATADDRFAAVVRFNGGHNAGHTLVAGGRRCVVSLVPSGVMSGAMGIIGNGVVVDPFVLLAEIDRLQHEGHDISPHTLRIADTVTLVLPIHIELDRLNNRIGGLGTTGRGIGPAYEDKVGRRALRLCDLADGGYARDRLAALIERANALLRCCGERTFELEEVWGPLSEVRERLRPYSEGTVDRLEQLSRTRRLLFEGAQSVLLDVDHGTYPFVTSSSCVAASAAAGSGLAPRHVGIVLGVAKAYQTRVGQGPFPTEDDGPAGAMLFTKGREVGTNTGRRRRCGWLDAALLRDACRTAGIARLALTKVDVLDGVPSIHLGVGYLLDGERVDALPPLPSAQARAMPVYETVDGWSARTHGARSVEDLPAAAIAYVRRIEELVGVPIVLLSTGPDRDDTIRLGEVW
jgi:adenylosuccinate synthase